MRRHVVGPKPVGGPTPSTIRTRAQGGPPVQSGAGRRWRSSLLVLLGLALVALVVWGIGAYRSM